MKKFYVTTPIYYANDKPHVGHAYTTIAADILFRYWQKRLGSDNVFFLTGTDEHGQKISDAAEIAGKNPHEFVNSLVPRFQHAWDKLNIQPSVFMRTTFREHIEYAQEFLKILHTNDDIYKDIYEGFYCVGCEKYITPTEMVGDHCPDHPNLECQKRRQENYFFRLTKYTAQVKELITSNQLQIKPESRRNEVLARLDGDLIDLSISRPTLEWGVPVPWDETHTVYVWTEALLNYLSALKMKELEDFWPADVQLMGKEILWFHAVIWPAMLIAAQREVPKIIFAHGWFTINGQKMSKTLGNVIDPVELVEQWGTDAVRYFLISAVKFGHDGDLALDQFAQIYEGDLANALGNLLQRTVTLIKRSGIKIAVGAKPSCAEADQAIEELRLDDGLKAIWRIVNDANKRLEDGKPWELIKNHRQQVTGDRLEETLTTAYRQLETIATGLEPYMPETSAAIFKQLETMEARPLFPSKKNQFNH